MNNKINLDQKFFFGGKAIFTIQSEKTGEHRTFKIVHKAANQQFPFPSNLVFLLTGPDNTRHYTYICKINEFNGELTFTKGSKRTEDSPDIKILRWFMGHLFGDGYLTNATVRHSGKCGCCGRQLTHPESLITGIGPECRRRMGM